MKTWRLEDLERTREDLESEQAAIAIDASVLPFIGGLTVVAVLLCMAVPAWQVAHLNFAPFLRTNDNAPRTSWRGRGTLIALQIALATVLLVGAGLLARTASQLMHEAGD